MTTAGGIIIWTLILFVLVASQDTVLQGEEGAVCNFTVSEPKTQFVRTREKCAGIWARFSWSSREKCAEENRTFITSSIERRCCEGYENKNSICKLQCSPECEDGRYCAKSKKCECFPGWVGQNCTESLWCVVKVNSTTILSERMRKRLLYAQICSISCSREITSNLSVEVPYNDTSTESKRPECLPQCRDQISNLFVNVAKLEDMNIYFVPIESPCNIKVNGTSENIFKKYKYPLAGTLGIILCAIVIFCVTCCLKRKRESLCDAEDIPMKTQATQDYMVENTIYS